jgi:peptide chain release factor 1
LRGKTEPLTQGIMLEKLQAIKERWDEVESELTKPETIADMKRFAKLNKEYKDLGKIIYTKI